MNIFKTIAVICCLGMGAVLFAETSAPSNRNLEERVAALEARVQALESKITVQAAVIDTQAEQIKKGLVLVPTNKWKDIGLWHRKLARGMSQQDVREMFGDPTKTESDAARGDTWYYGSPGGYVQFGPDGHVTSWSEPHLR